MQRARIQPDAMLALSTHDHKRGADVRARLATISRDAQSWIDEAQGWFEVNAAIRPEGLERGDEYILYQMLIGTWPLTAPDEDYTARINAWWRKALREAKLRTGWAAPNQAYEQLAEEFLHALLDPTISLRFHEAIGRYQARIGPASALNGLAQAILQCTAPGVPDIYQGSEFWDLSMVDPDNRRPVNFVARQAALQGAPEDDHLRASWKDGRVKQSLLKRLLTARRDHPALFRRGRYQPLAARGPRADEVLAFCREAEGLMLAVIVPISTPASVDESLSLQAEWWADTAVALPAGASEWQPIAGAPPSAGRVKLTQSGLGCRVLLGSR